MKTYIEAIPTNEELQMISEEVTNSEEDAISLVNSQKVEGEEYTMRRHKCYHEEKKSCEIEEL